VKQATEPVLAQGIRTEDDALVIVLADREVRVPWEKCPRSIADATPRQRCNAELSPGGYGIHWPDIDEDLTIAGLVAQGK